MKACSEDLRIRALNAMDTGTPRIDVVRLFGVSMPTITPSWRHHRETGTTI